MLVVALDVGTSSARARVFDAAGRAQAGAEGHVAYEPTTSADGGVETLVDHVGRWRGVGATHVSINTMNAGLGPVDAHLAALEGVAKELFPG